ncbi:MAG: CTP synthase, partial [Acidimicrobiaceae bacterium]|nr:CTP synthase [Acidimicrobiaceae bacterium]
FDGVTPDGEAAHSLDLSGWERLVARVESAVEPVRIGLIGKYVNLPDAYLSVVEALRHGGYAHEAAIDLEWIQAEEVAGLLADGRLRDLDGIVIPGGFGERGIEGKITAASYAREHGIPCLGLCLGLQVMVIEFARNVVGLEGANSREFDRHAPHPVIDLMEEQRDVRDLGGTMRLGTWPAKLKAGSQVAEAYGELLVYERHRHRYEVNPRYRSRLEEGGLMAAGVSPDDRLVEFIELPGHPYWVGTQAHPEFKSRPDRAHPLFRGLIGAALERARSRRSAEPALAGGSSAGGARGELALENSGPADGPGRPEDGVGRPEERLAHEVERRHERERAERHQAPSEVGTPR